MRRRQSIPRPPERHVQTLEGVKTKSDQEMFESWENTIERIFKQNEKNLLLEFTATHDYDTPAMVEKYRNKVIIRYDLPL